MNDELVLEVAHQLYRPNVARDAWDEEQSHLRDAYVARVRSLAQALDALGYEVVQKQAVKEVELEVEAIEEDEKPKRSYRRHSGED